MNLVPVNISRTVARTILTTKKHSPHLFFAGGITGVIGSTFLACRATLKLETTIDKIKADLKEVKTHKDAFGNTSYSDADYTHDLQVVYIRSVRDISKLYGPAAIIGSVSIAALTGSHIQLTRRNAALSTTLAMVSKAYNDYRGRVQDEIGTDKELDIYRATKTQEVDVDGKKKLVKITDPNGLSPYARIFDEASPNWEKNAEINRIFIQCQQNYANHRLRARGHVFLNEVYDALGFERTQAGQVVGWIINGDGDGYVDFGLFEAHSSPFINGTERSIILDFNVDGIIQNKI